MNQTKQILNIKTYQTKHHGFSLRKILFLLKSKLIEKNRIFDTYSFVHCYFEMIFDDVRKCILLKGDPRNPRAYNPKMLRFLKKRFEDWICI